MTGKEWKYQLEGEKLQCKAEEIVRNFLNRNLDNGYIFESIKNCRNWIYDVYPDLLDETEHDEELISAFIAGMVCTLINTPGTGVRWIYTVQPDENEERTDLQ